MSDVCHTNQIGSTTNSKSNFVFLLQTRVTRYFCLLVSNGNLTLVFPGKVVAIKKLTLVDLSDLSCPNLFWGILIFRIKGNC